MTLINIYIKLDQDILSKNNDHNATNTITDKNNDNIYKILIFSFLLPD